MDQKKISGTIAMWMGIAMVTIGMGSQVWKNYNDKGCGITILMIILPMAMLICRIWHAKVIKNPYMLIPDAVGLCALTILLTQYICYF